MPTIKELREKRANAWSLAQDYNSRSELTAEDEAAWKRAIDDVDTLGEQIETRERTENLDKRFSDIDASTNVADTRGAAGASIDQYRSAFETYLRHGITELDAEQRSLLQANFDPNLRAQGTTSGSVGGYTVPEGFWAKVTETQKFFGGMLEDESAESVNTDSGAALPWPTNDDTGNVGAILGENTQITEQDVAFGQKTLGAYTYTSKLIRVSLQLLQDSGLDLESFLSRRIGERLGRAKNAHFTTGTGTSQPQGIITGATVGKTAASATAITYDEIVDLVHSVDAAYRGSGRAAFQLHDLVLAYVRKLRDESGGAGVGRPLWEPSVQVGVPDSLLGFRVRVNNDMASTIATGNKTIAFGDFVAAYARRSVSGGQVMRLAERYADYLQVGFFGFERADGLVQDASAVKVLAQL